MGKALLGLLAAAWMMVATVPALGTSYGDWQQPQAIERPVQAIPPKKTVRYRPLHKIVRRVPPKAIQVAALPSKTTVTDVIPAYDWSRVALPKVPEIELEPPSPSIITDPVEEYLCQVYNRMPIKADSSGDFTWKDQAAAKKEGMDVCKYAIGGMHTSLKKGLFEIGKKADEANIPWSFLSGYRGEYRQRIAAGFKAGPCGSMHSGQKCKEQGYGQGKAADIWTFTPDGKPGGSPFPLFALFDKLGASVGITRPMKGGDPAHIQLFQVRPEIASTGRQRSSRLRR